MTDPKPIYCERCESARKVVKDHQEITKSIHLEKEKLKGIIQDMARTIKGLRMRIRTIKNAVELEPTKYDEMTSEELFGA